MESGFGKQENYRNVPSLEREKETLKLQLAENRLLMLYEHPTTYLTGVLEILGHQVVPRLYR